MTVEALLSSFDSSSYQLIADSLGNYGFFFDNIPNLFSLFSSANRSYSLNFISLTVLLLFIIELFFDISATKSRSSLLDI